MTLAAACLKCNFHCMCSLYFSKKNEISYDPCILYIQLDVNRQTSESLFKKKKRKKKSTKVSIAEEAP